MQNALSMVSEAEPAEEAAEGARLGFAELVARHTNLVYRIALAITRSPHDAEDVAQVDISAALSRRQVGAD